MSASVNTDLQSIARAFVDARLRGASFPEYPGVVPPDLTSAYAVQRAAIDLWPDQIVGWKVARVPAASRAAYNEERLVGPVFARNLHRAINDEVLEVPVIQGGFAAVEAEIVIVVGRDAPADKLDWTTDEAAAMVGSMHSGVEIASSPLATLNDLGAGSIISDFGNNWGVLIGPVIHDWQHPRAIACSTFIDDAVVGTASRAVPGEPMDAFAFALSRCAQLQRPLRQGHAIATGMITGVHDILVGQHARFVFAGCGELRCRTRREGAYIAHSPV